MGNIRTIPAYGKVVTTVGDFYLVSADNVNKVVPCKMDLGFYPAPVMADFTNVQHVVARFAKTTPIEVDFDRISA